MERYGVELGQRVCYKGQIFRDNVLSMFKTEYDLLSRLQVRYSLNWPFPSSYSIKGLFSFAFLLTL